jgi:hypothetical protein
MGQGLVSTVKCYFDQCEQKVEWHIFVDPGTYSCDDHAPGDYVQPLTDNSQEIVIQLLPK